MPEPIVPAPTTPMIGVAGPDASAGSGVAISPEMHVISGAASAGGSPPMCVASACRMPGRWSAPRSRRPRGASRCSTSTTSRRRRSQAASAPEHQWLRQQRRQESAKACPRRAAAWRSSASGSGSAASAGSGSEWAAWAARRRRRLRRQGWGRGRGGWRRRSRRWRRSRRRRELLAAAIDPEDLHLVVLVDVAVPEQLVMPVGQLIGARFRLAISPSPWVSCPGKDDRPLSPGAHSWISHDPDCSGSAKKK